MTGNDAGPVLPPDVRDKRTPPSGVLPKNTQAWVLSGLAVVMVSVIALSGHNAPKEKSSTAGACRRRPRTPTRPRFKNTKAASTKRRRDSKERKSNWPGRSRPLAVAFRESLRREPDIPAHTGVPRKRACRPASQVLKKALFRSTGTNVNNNRCLLPTSP